MEVVLGKTAGFCFGVDNAVRKAEEILEHQSTVYCLGEIVHNKEVVKKLEDKGLRTIQNMEEAKNEDVVIIRAHGVPRKTYEYAKENNIELIDLTCPKVLEIHMLVEKYAKEGYYIVLIGAKAHPENIGTISFAGKNASILEDREEIDDIIELIKKANLPKLLIIAQTTFAVDKFNEYVEILESKLSFNMKIEVIDTICKTTRLRQEETKKIAKDSDLMIIIGGKNSSNTTKLYDIAVKTCGNAMHVETKEDLYMNYIRRFKKIGVMAGASTSQESIKEIMEVLQED